MGGVLIFIFSRCMLGSNSVVLGYFGTEDPQEKAANKYHNSYFKESVFFCNVSSFKLPI